MRKTRVRRSKGGANQSEPNSYKSMSRANSTRTQKRAKGNSCVSRRVSGRGRGTWTDEDGVIIKPYLSECLARQENYLIGTELHRKVKTNTTDKKGREYAKPLKHSINQQIENAFLTKDMDTVRDLCMISFPKVVSDGFITYAYADMESKQLRVLLDKEESTFTLYTNQECNRTILDRSGDPYLETVDAPLDYSMCPSLYLSDIEGLYTPMTYQLSLLCFYGEIPFLSYPTHLLLQCVGKIVRELTYFFTDNNPDPIRDAYSDKREYDRWSHFFYKKYNGESFTIQEAHDLFDACGLHLEDMEMEDVLSKRRTLLTVEDSVPISIDIYNQGQTIPSRFIQIAVFNYLKKHKLVLPKEREAAYFDPIMEEWSEPLLSMRLPFFRSVYPILRVLHRSCDPGGPSNGFLAVSHGWAHDYGPNTSLNNKEYYKNFARSLGYTKEDIRTIIKPFCYSLYAYTETSQHGTQETRVRFDRSAPGSIHVSRDKKSMPMKLGVLETDVRHMEVSSDALAKPGTFNIGIKGLEKLNSRTNGGSVYMVGDHTMSLLGKSYHLKSTGAELTPVLEDKVAIVERALENLGMTHTNQMIATLNFLERTNPKPDQYTLIERALLNLKRQNIPSQGVPLDTMKMAKFIPLYFEEEKMVANDFLLGILKDTVLSTTLLKLNQSIDSKTKDIDKYVNKYRAEYKDEKQRVTLEMEVEAEMAIEKIRERRDQLALLQANRESGEVQEIIEIEEEINELTKFATTASQEAANAKAYLQQAAAEESTSQTTPNAPNTRSNAPNAPNTRSNTRSNRANSIPANSTSSSSSSSSANAGMGLSTSSIGKNSKTGFHAFPSSWSASKGSSVFPSSWTMGSTLGSGMGSVQFGGPWTQFSEKTSDLSKHLSPNFKPPTFVFKADSTVKSEAKPTQNPLFLRNKSNGSNT